MTNEMVAFGTSLAEADRLRKLVDELLDWLDERKLTAPEAISVCANALVAIHTLELSDGDRVAAARAIARKFAEMSESVNHEQKNRH